MARMRWWLVFVARRVLLGGVGLTLLSSIAELLVICLGVLFVVFALCRRTGELTAVASGPNPRAAAATSEAGWNARGPLRLRLALGAWADIPQ
jgi:hypothetical protein